jgi:hypothetical protein
MSREQRTFSAVRGPLFVHRLSTKAVFNGICRHLTSGHKTNGLGDSLNYLD